MCGRPGGAWGPHQGVCCRPGGVSLQAAKSLGPGITEKANFRKYSVKTSLVLSMWYLKTHFEKNWTKLMNYGMKKFIPQKYKIDMKLN